jgi:hypothetical protein
VRFTVGLFLAKALQKVWHLEKAADLAFAALVVTLSSDANRLTGIITKDQTTHGDENTHRQRAASHSLERAVVEMGERSADIGAFVGGGIILVEMDVRRHAEANHDGQLSPAAAKSGATERYATARLWTITDRSWVGKS